MIEAAMTSEEFRAACMLLWGCEFTPEAAAFLGVSARNVRYFASGGKVVGAGLRAVLIEELRRQAFDSDTPTMRIIREATGTLVAA